METALAEVKAAENAWNTRDPERVALAYSEDSAWRSRIDFINGREEIKAFRIESGKKSLITNSKKSFGAFAKIESR